MNEKSDKCFGKIRIHAGEMKLNLLPIMKLKMNRIVSVQECDATMFNQRMMLVNKKENN